MYDAIYARQSIYRDESASIATQKSLSEKFATNEILYYTDVGFSGKNMNRPAFKELISDIEKKKIDKLIVYKIDRLSRSILDFSKTWDLLSQYNVTFISATESLDTSTPMGKTMIFIMAIFAELERNQIQARIVDSINNRIDLNIWYCGVAPFGYINTKSHKKRATIIPDNERKAVVQRIFALYADGCFSCNDIANILNKDNVISSHGCGWCSATIKQIIKNLTYVQADSILYDYLMKKGFEVLNPKTDFIGVNAGIEVRRCNKETAKKYFVGDWDYIIESSVFIRCQEVMSDNKHLKRRKSSYTWLSGVVKCGCCGGSFFIPKGSIAKYRKFYCNNKYKKGLCNESKPISVSEIEDDITNQIFRKHALNISTMEFNDKKRILLSLIEKIQVFPDKNIVIWKNN